MAPQAGCIGTCQKLSYIQDTYKKKDWDVLNDLMLFPARCNITTRTTHVYGDGTLPLAGIEGTDVM